MGRNPRMAAKMALSLIGGWLLWARRAQRTVSDGPKWPGTNQKSPEPLDSNMLSEISAWQLPPELPLRAV
jgi:hypothetical protein